MDEIITLPADDTVRLTGEAVVARGARCKCARCAVRPEAEDLAEDGGCTLPRFHSQRGRGGGASS